MASSNAKKTRSRKPPTEKDQDEIKGLRYSTTITGKYLFRIRERHVRDHYVPLMQRKALSAVKLDLVLRGIALLPQHAGGRREVGLVLPSISYEDLHDFVRPGDTYSKSHGELYDNDEAKHRELKREWVREQIKKLEDLKLVRRVGRDGGGRPRLIVLRDDGTGSDFDDPEGTGEDTYLTVLGGIISSGQLKSWRTPEVSFYMAAMIAERHHRYQTSTKTMTGNGEWFQALVWFADEKEYRPESHVRIAFSTATLDRGLRSFLDKGLVTKKLTRKNPRTSQRFLRGPRNIYKNHFSTLTMPAAAVDLVSGPDTEPS